MPNKPKLQNSEKFQVRTAILVDGGFYRKRAQSLLGYKPPKERANELEKYCIEHLRDSYEHRYLYRIFYYDCPPLQKVIYNPITQKSFDLAKTPDYSWAVSFFDELRHRRKFSLRMGAISENSIYYTIKPDIVKKLFRGDQKINELNQSDLSLHLEQKGVDMRIGVDISSLSFKHQVDQIILISGDSDFVPAAKQARREGIDFILDPMRSPIRPDLHEHIDGIRTPRSLPKFKIDSHN